MQAADGGSEAVYRQEMYGLASGLMGRLFGPGIVSVEFAQDPDDPAVRIVRAWHSGDRKLHTALAAAGV